MNALSALLDLLYPPRCAFCHKLTEDRSAFCSRCRASLPYTRGGGEKHGNFFSVCWSPLYYEKDVRASLHRYKFGQATGYAAVYAPLVAECIRERLDGEYDLISWVPLSRKRLRERGYDQSRLLAEAVAPLLGGEAVSTLEKPRNTPKQSTMGAAEQRRANIAGAYRVSEPERLAGRRVLLLDDIVTTGATLSECAGTLLSAGAAGVVCATVARTRD
ncbi:MAG: ComF family protein [Oscillospiraceae bacterium]|nr:ComF family protein [Oscillospiraceae bacterium]MBR1497722.1 ComF family protein [Oscillospiraceae bacterium]